MARQIRQAGRMKTNITVTADDRARLERLIGDRNAPAKVVWRSRIAASAPGGVASRQDHPVGVELVI